MAKRIPKRPKAALGRPTEAVYLEESGAYDQSLRWEALLQRAAKDQTFRRELIEDPKRALLDAGFQIPAEVRVVVHDYNPQEQHLFLPPADAQLEEPEIDALYQYKYRGREAR
ncbi:hypothetical protein [Nitrospira sp. Nam74]